MGIYKAEIKGEREKAKEIQEKQMSREEGKGEVLRVPATSGVLESSSWAGLSDGCAGEKGDS